MFQNLTYVYSLSHVRPSFPFVFPGRPLAQIQLDGRPTMAGPCLLGVQHMDR